MSHDDILRIAREAGMLVGLDTGTTVCGPESLSRFARAIEYAALERAAVIAEEISRASYDRFKDDRDLRQPYASNRLLHVGWDTAAAIRAAKGE